MDLNEIRAGLAESGYTIATQNYGHGHHLDKVICIDCGKPVGAKGRGSRQCWDCLEAEIAREKASVEVQA